MREQWYEEPPFVIGGLLGILGLVGYLGHELFLHLREILAYGVEPCIRAFWAGVSGFTGVLVAGVGPVVASTT